MTSSQEMKLQQLAEKALRDGVEYFVSGTLLFKDSKLLLIQRANHDVLGGMYEIPGGLVEEGEGILEASIRELFEETSLSGTGFSYVSSFDYRSLRSKALIRQFNFKVRKWSGNIKLDPNEHQHFLWVTRSQIERRELPMTDGMQKVLLTSW